MLHIKLVKSPIGNTKNNRKIVVALGLRKMHQTVVHNDTPSIRGMIHRVKHMLLVTEGPEVEKTGATPGRTASIAKSAEKAPKAKKAEAAAETKPKTVKKAAKKSEE